MNGKIAQTSIPIGNLRLIGNIGLEGDGNPINLFASIISSTIGLLTVIAAIYFIFVIITAAISIISAGGDKVALEEGQKRLTSGFIGLVIVVAAMFIVDFITDILGIPDILDIAAMIDRIRL